MNRSQVERHVDGAAGTPRLRRRRDEAVIAKGLCDVEGLRVRLADPALVALYGELADDDRFLAEEGMADFAAGLEEADRR